MEITTSIDRSTRSRESDFIHRQELQRRDAQRAQEERARERQALAAALWIQDLTVADRLLDAGVRARAAEAFGLLPLVEMAWVDGRVEASEREAVLEAALDAGLTIGSPAHRQLEVWLREEPPKALYEAWRAWISRDHTHDFDDIVLEHARNVANAGGGFFGLAHVSHDVGALLDRIRRSYWREEKQS